MKIKTIIMILALAMALAACGNTHDNPASVNSSLPQSPAEEAPAPVRPGQHNPSPHRVTGLSGINAENYPRIDGSTANMPLLAALYSAICGVPLSEAEAFVQVSGGTGVVWRNMMWGGTDLLLVYEAPDNIKQEMIEWEIWEQLDIIPVGRDGLVFLVNADNPVNNLSLEQLRGIYSGAITDWAEVGGSPGPISAFQRNLESGSQTLFLNLLMRDTTPMDAPSELRPGGMGGLMQSISQFDGSGGAIGFSVYYYADLMYDAPNLKLLSVDGIPPTTESIGSRRYPLCNDFYAVIRRDEPEGTPARILRDWLFTDEARQLMREFNYVPVG